jgi:uncharacterized membrane protein
VDEVADVSELTPSAAYMLRSETPEAVMENPVKSLLLGKWLGDPLHPAIVHIPIAAWVGALIFDILGLCGVGEPGLFRASFWLIAVGLISTLIVVPAGLAEWSEIKRGKPAWRLALWHMILNVVATLLFAGSLWLRWENGLNSLPTVAFVLVIIGDSVLGVSGYLGGRLVYAHGIAVARMSKKKWRDIAAAGNANLPPQS